MNSQWEKMRSRIRQYWKSVPEGLNSLNGITGIMLFLIILSVGIETSAQENAYLYRLNRYDFIRYDNNQLHHFQENKYGQAFHQKLEDLIRSGKGRINIVQIGGSHIQAGTFSGQMRMRLQGMNGDLNAGIGYMFPYQLARTNTPGGYYIRYEGYWKSRRNIEKKKTGTIGVGGIASTTQSDRAALTVLIEKDEQTDHSFDKIKVFYESSGTGYALEADSSMVESIVQRDTYYEIKLKEHTDSLRINLSKSRNSQASFTLHGVVAEQETHGILYHSIGINGAHVPAFLRCQLFEEHLEVLKPDLVILGLGINDAYGRRFSQKKFEENYSELIGRIRKAAPDAAILFTTNNDSYLYRRYVNKNGIKVRESMFRLAENHDTGIWDMFSVMGGLNSIVLWQKNGLAQRDKVHFTREGYLMIGDLLFTALVRDFEKYLVEKEFITIKR